MALSGSILADALIVALKITDPSGQSQAAIQVLCNTIVAHIQTNADVSFAVVSTVIAPGGGSGGPCVGSLTSGTVA